MAIQVGDKCIIIKSEAGNEGRIVLVTDHFDPSTSRWEGKPVHPTCTVLITSLGSPLTKTNGATAMTGPIDPTCLRKLPTADSPELTLMTTE